MRNGPGCTAHVNVMRSLTYEMNREFGGLGVVQEKRRALLRFTHTHFTSALASRGISEMSWVSEKEKGNAGIGGETRPRDGSRVELPRGRPFMRTRKCTCRYHPVAPSSGITTKSPLSSRMSLRSLPNTTVARRRPSPRKYASFTCSFSGSQTYVHADPAFAFFHESSL